MLQKEQIKKRQCWLPLSGTFSLLGEQRIYKKFDLISVSDMPLNVKKIELFRLFCNTLNHINSRDIRECENAVYRKYLDVPKEH